MKKYSLSEREKRYLMKIAGKRKTGFTIALIIFSVLAVVMIFSIVFNTETPSTDTLIVTGISMLFALVCACVAWLCRNEHREIKENKVNYGLSVLMRKETESDGNNNTDFYFYCEDGERIPVYNNSRKDYYSAEPGSQILIIDCYDEKKSGMLFSLFQKQSKK